MPQSNDHQQVELVGKELPADGQVATEPTYGNKILYFESTTPASGDLEFKTSYRVRRKEVLGLKNETGEADLTEKQRKLFLSANRRVPLDGKPLQRAIADDRHDFRRT